MLSNPCGDYVVDVILPLRLCHAVKLLVALPLVEQMADGHEPDLELCSTQQGYTVEYQPGKQRVVAYPTGTFFEDSSSLLTSRFVPLYIDSMIAAL